MTTERLKIMIRVLPNDKIMVRDMNETEAKVFSEMDQALNYVKSQNVKSKLAEVDYE